MHYFIVIGNFFKTLSEEFSLTTFSMMLKETRVEGGEASNTFPVAQ